MPCSRRPWPQFFHAEAGFAVRLRGNTRGLRCRSRGHWRPVHRGGPCARLPARPDRNPSPGISPNRGTFLVQRTIFGTAIATPRSWTLPPPRLLLRGTGACSTGSAWKLRPRRSGRRCRFRYRCPSRRGASPGSLSRPHRARRSGVRQICRSCCWGSSPGLALTARPVVRPSTPLPVRPLPLQPERSAGPEAWPLPASQPAPKRHRRLRRHESHHRQRL